MQNPMSDPQRRRALWLSLLTAVALTPLTLTAPALERRTVLEPRQGKPEAALQTEAATRQRAVQKSPMPVEWQLEQLRGRIQQLEERVAALQSQGQRRGAAGSNVAGRLAALESVVQVDSDTLRLHSPGAVEIQTGGAITLNGSHVSMAAGNVELHSALLRVHGTAQSVQVVTDAVISKTYTPGAGNVW